MTGHSSVGGFSLNHAVFVQKHGSHKTKRTISLSNDIGLDISVVVFAGPDESTVSLEDLGNHVVDESVLVVDALRLVVLLIVLLVDLLENVLE